MAKRKPHKKKRLAKRKSHKRLEKTPSNSDNFTHNAPNPIKREKEDKKSRN